MQNQHVFCSFSAKVLKLLVTEVRGYEYQNVNGTFSTQRRKVKLTFQAAIAQLVDSWFRI